LKIVPYFFGYEFNSSVLHFNDLPTASDYFATQADNFASTSNYSLHDADDFASTSNYSLHESDDFVSTSNYSLYEADDLMSASNYSLHDADDFVSTSNYLLYNLHCFMPACCLHACMKKQPPLHQHGKTDFNNKTNQLTRATEK